MPTNPITTLAELDEALATLREPKPSEPLPYDALPHQCHSTGGIWGWDGVGEWVNTFHPTNSEADALALLEWARHSRNASFEIMDDDCWDFRVTLPDYEVGVAKLPDFKIAASVAVARACGLAVELEGTPALAREVEGG